MNLSADLYQIAKKVTDRIIEKTHPEKVFLFGSVARGEATQQSDIDLLIIAKTDKPFPSRMSPIHDILREMKYPWSVESVIYTPEEFKRAQEKGSLFIYEVITTGQLLYGS